VGQEKTGIIDPAPVTVQLNPDPSQESVAVPAWDIVGFTGATFNEIYRSK
jgi:hypothetical protein